MNPGVDFYFTKAKNWQQELDVLRTIILESGLTEELKWGVPCYTFQKANIVLLHSFKNYCALLFFKGALLNDGHNILVQQTENVQSARQVRFTKTNEIERLKPILKAYINEAIEVEKAGLKVKVQESTALTYPEEFQTKLAESPSLKLAFEALTPGRQRAYCLFFAAPKQSKTRAARVDKCLPQILSGKGLHDR